MDDRRREGLMLFRMLGPMEVWAGKRQLPLGGTLQRGLLAVLLLNANQVVGTGRLIESLWSGNPPRTARADLHGRIARLRRTLRHGAGDDGPDRLSSRPPGYLLRVATGELDLDDFIRLTDQGCRSLAAGELDAARDALDAGLALWRGEPMEELPLTVCQATGAGWTERRLLAAEDLIEVDLRSGRHAQLASVLPPLVTEYPLRERLCGQQMLMLYRCGDPAGALAAYRRISADLRSELGLDAGPELQRLERAMLARDSSMESPTPGHLDSAPAPDAPGFPPWMAELPSPAQLTMDIRGFVGREEELAQLDALLDRAGDHPTAVPVSTLSGAAGVGKTALALHWAHQVRHLFPDGQLYVNLHGSGSDAPPLTPSEAIHGFLQALAYPPERIPATVDLRSALYRTLLSNRRVLVLLDNARDSAQVRPLLPGSAGCLVLVTSRDQLDGIVAEECAYPMVIGPLTPTAARHLLVRRLGAARIAAEPEPVRQLVASCARQPLALTLVAARAVMPGDRPHTILAAEIRAEAAASSPVHGPAAKRSVVVRSLTTIGPVRPMPALAAQRDGG
jgi:DNA-binding SARP family transcriptional activator